MTAIALSSVSLINEEDGGWRGQVGGGLDVIPYQNERVAEAHDIIDSTISLRINQKDENVITYVTSLRMCDFITYV